MFGVDATTDFALFVPQDADHVCHVEIAYGVVFESLKKTVRSQRRRKPFSIDSEEMSSAAVQTQKDETEVVLQARTEPELPA